MQSPLLVVLPELDTVVSPLAQPGVRNGSGV